MAPVVKQRPPGSSVLRKIDDFVNNSILPMAQVVECGTFPTCFTFVPIEDETLMNIMHITNSECPGFLADKQIFIEKMNRAYDMYKGVLRPISISLIWFVAATGLFGKTTEEDFE